MHTPGPWAFIVGDAERRDSSTIHKAGDKEFTLAHVICEWRNQKQRAEDIANAALIAAAPDLLAACKEVADVIQGGDKFERLEPWAQEIVTTLREAIDKAEGQRLAAGAAGRE